MSQVSTSGGPATKSTAAPELLGLPAGIGRSLVEASAVISCPLLGTDKFLKFCRERGVALDRRRLLRLERLGAFAPVFRVGTPPKDVPPFDIPVQPGNDWFETGWAWDTTGVPALHPVPDDTDRSCEGYYSIFQIEFLHLVLTQVTLSVEMDGFLDRTDTEQIDWAKNGANWLRHAKDRVESLRVHEFRRVVALLCQYISNRYYPLTQGDKRTIQLGHGHSFDRWVAIRGFDWDWHQEARDWDPQQVASLFDLTPKKLDHAYHCLALAQAHCDPLERWYQLVQFVSVRERRRLKGDALRAATLRAGADMLRLLYEDLYGEELPNPNEVTGTIITHVPELSVREDPRRHLEFVVNRYGLNPQPKLSLFVEGQSEEVAISRIFALHYGAHPGTFGIEIVVLGGVDVATGSKRKDRFRAILRLMDYLHHHQTVTFLLLDDENHARQLKAQARKAKSIHSQSRYITRPEYIRIWKPSFEFANFTCTEIAKAMGELAQGHGHFSVSDIAECKREKNPGRKLEDLYHQRTSAHLAKPLLAERLAEKMFSDQARRAVASRPIIKTLDRVVRLAVRNPLPVMLESWEKNQASKYLGKKRRVPKRPS